MLSSKKYLKELGAIRNLFDASSLQRKSEILDLLSKDKSLNDSSLLEIQETILFLSAYPHSESFAEKLGIFQKELTRRIKVWIKKNKKEGKFEESGLSGTKVNAHFSFELLEWLIHSYPEQILFDCFDAEEEIVYSTLNALLPFALKENLNDGIHESPQEWLQSIAGKDRYTQLKFVVQLIRSASLDSGTRNLFLEQLKIYVNVPLEKIPGRNEILGRNQKHYIHEEALIKKVAAFEIIQETIHSLEIRQPEIESLIIAMRLQLLSLYRETDPVTFTNDKDVHVYDVGRGMDIVLMGMDVEHRHSADAYIGFMAFKNQQPYAYGGAWLLGPMAKIGINVFPSYRGGESAWFFAQLMRVYYQQFKFTYFVAEPYQVGRGNPEGIESGAFWFYYRLGFRPMKKELQQIAEREFQKLKTGKLKRSTNATLEKLVEDEMVFLIDPKVISVKNKYDTLQLSAALSKVIQGNFKGSADAFLSKSKVELLKSSPELKKRPNQPLILTREKLSPYLLAGGGIDSWTHEEKKKLVELLYEKTCGRDSEYARLMVQHKKLNQLLYDLASNTEK